MLMIWGNDVEKWVVGWSKGVAWTSVQGLKVSFNVFVVVFLSPVFFFFVFPSKGWIDGARTSFQGFMNNSPLFEERRLPLPPHSTTTEHYHQKPSGSRLLLTIASHLSEMEKNNFKIETFFRQRKHIFVCWSKCELIELGIYQPKLFTNRQSISANF